MGIVYEDLLVKNADQQSAANLGFMKEDEVKQTVVRFKADTGASANVITEDIVKALNLKIGGKRRVRLAGGSETDFDEASKIQIWWRNRNVTMDALIAPSGADNLLSVISMEALDVMPDVAHRKLIPVHGDLWLSELG